MKLKIVAVGSRCPDWAARGYAEYAKRLPPPYELELVEIATRQQASSARYVAEEGSKILRRIDVGDWVVVLDEHGVSRTSKQLAEDLLDWRQNARQIVFVIGGADGLSQEAKSRANTTWSLSKLTLPHYLVRPLLAEALYRAWSINSGHPYHRA